jgi:methionine-S-sulfoxide reductase
MTEERAVLAGGCFWGVQDLIRSYDGVLSTRVGYTGGSNSHATYRNHPGHAEAVEIIFDPARVSYRRILELFFQIHDPSTRNRQGNDVGTSYRSAIFYTVTSRSGLRKTRSPMWMLQACGLAKLLPKSFRHATSGRPNPSIKIISNEIPAAIPAISSGPTGDCRFAPTRLQNRLNTRSSSKSQVKRRAMQSTAPVRSTVCVIASSMLLLCWPRRATG